VTLRIEAATLALAAVGLTFGMLAASPSPLRAAQAEAVTDSSARADTLEVRPDVRLEDLRVTVTRTTEEWARTPYALSIVGKQQIQRAARALSLDQALRGIPGVTVDLVTVEIIDGYVDINGDGDSVDTQEIFELKFDQPGWSPACKVVEVSVADITPLIDSAMPDMAIKTFAALFNPGPTADVEAFSDTGELRNCVQQRMTGGL